MNRSDWAGLAITALVLATGCNGPMEPEPEMTDELRTTRIHIDGFMRSKSGAI